MDIGTPLKCGNWYNTNPGYSTLWAHFSLGIGKFDTLLNPLLTLGKDDNHLQVTMSRTEVSAKRTATSPASKENKKPKDDICLICSESVTDDVLEYVSQIKYS